MSKRLPGGSQYGILFALTLGVVGCIESGAPLATSPELTAESARAQMDVQATPGPSPSATGSGHTVVSGELRTFSFSAQQDADGTGGGTAEINNRSIDEMFQIDLDCLKVVDNVAIASGVITKHTDSHAVGLTGVFGVIDAGEGEAVSDSVTQVFIFRPGIVTCQDPDPADVRAFATPIVSGNVQVH